MTAEAIEGGAEPPAPRSGLTPVDRGYVQVLRVQTLLSWVPPVIGAIVFDRLVLADTSWGGLLLVLVPLLAALTVVIAPIRVWLRLGYALEPAMLRVVRGWLVHTDTLVPLVRVQHLDIARGPLDKMFGTATLAIHTAGTHNSIVSLPGLAPSRAAELAAVIRTHVKADID
ncbi:PH domain-containing protein [Sphingomonas sp. LHG3406-1]|uniref:PH domain-containing protein n=1 Tax=Sphingomonas sp. LHG3406-1 TaxID=2804617 RepID=UPI002613BEA9|nr:PH domain-containing protein [Sphingomonas sp. LHG3406-1]